MPNLRQALRRALWGTALYDLIRRLRQQRELRRLFTGRADYPTLDQVRDLVAAERPGWTLEIGHDVVRIHRR